MLYEDNYLAHFGIKGQKWGVRRFQNADGSLTAEGKERYNGGAFGKEQLKKLSQYRSKESELEYMNAKSHGGHRDKLIKIEDEHEQYVRKLVDTYVKNDPELKKAIAERKQAEKEEQEEWDRFNNQDYIRTIAENKKDPRHRSFRKSGDRYEFMGDGTEYWNMMASKKARDRDVQSRENYAKAVRNAMNKMFSNSKNISVHQDIKKNRIWKNRNARFIMPYLEWDMNEIPLSDEAYNKKYGK